MPLHDHYDVDDFILISNASGFFPLVSNYFQAIIIKKIMLKMCVYWHSEYKSCIVYEKENWGNLNAKM